MVRSTIRAVLLAGVLAVAGQNASHGQYTESYSVLKSCDFTGNALGAGFFADNYGTAACEYRNDRMVVTTPTSSGSTNCVFWTEEPRGSYRSAFDYRRPTTTLSTALELRLRRFWSPSYSTFYRITTTDDFVSNVVISRVREGTSPSTTNLTLSGTVPSWSASPLNTNYWQRVEATIEEVGGKPMIRLYIDGRLRAEAEDPSGSSLAWAAGDSWNVFTGNGKIELDNVVFDNLPNYTATTTQVETNRSHQEFVNVDFSNSGLVTTELGNDFPLVSGKLQADPAAGFKSLYVKDDDGLVLNLTDYAFSVDVSYRPSTPNGTQDFIVRRQWDNHSYTYPVDGTIYNYARDTGYLLRTSNRMDSFDLYRMVGGTQTPVVTNIDGLTGQLADNVVARLKMVANGKYVDVYLGGKRILSYVEAAGTYPRTGGPSIWSSGGGVNFDNLLVETDYYFWKKKGNDLIYRGQARIPNGFNMSFQQGHHGKDIYDFVLNPGQMGNEAHVAEPKKRIRVAAAAGARSIRFLPRIGYVQKATAPYFLNADLFYAMDHQIKFAEWDAACPEWTTPPDFPCQTAHPQDTLSAAEFKVYFDEMVEEARRNDIFLEFVLMDHQTNCWQRSDSADGVKFPSAGGVTGQFLDSPNFVRDNNVFEAYASRASSLVRLYSNEGIIFSWEFFNEPLTNIANMPDGWFFPNGSGSYTVNGWQDVASWFRRQTMVLTDVYRAETGLTLSQYSGYRTSDKHMMSSGIHGGPIAGYLFSPNSGSVSAFNPALASQNAFRDFEAYADSHSYGYSNSGLVTSASDQRSRGLNGYVPIRFGEVAIAADYAANPCPGLTCTTGGFQSLSLYKGNTYILTDCATPPASFPRVWKLLSGCSLGSTEAGFDGDPRYLSKGKRYAIWQPWFEDLTNSLNNTNVSVMLWSLDSHSGIDYAADYNPATHGVYSPWDNWISLNALEPNLHRGFLKHASKTWGQR